MDARIEIRVTEEEKIAWSLAAQLAGKTLSAWIRWKLSGERPVSMPVVPWASVQELKYEDES